jgi:hypothetical protein
MAGDWIKLQKDTFEKPEVVSIAEFLNLDPDTVVGKLARIWSWFDTHTVDGNATSVTFAFVNRLTGVTGFAEQLAAVGWLCQGEGGLTLPNFDFHNGETAKSRALGKNRTEKHRSNADTVTKNANSNADTVTKALPEKRREEKRREDKKEKEKEPIGSLPPYPQNLDVQVWERWVGYRKQIGKALRPASIPSAQQSLAKHGDNQSAVVEQSIANGWQGLFQLKTEAAARHAPFNRQEALEARNRAVVEAALAQGAHA